MICAVAGNLGNLSDYKVSENEDMRKGYHFVVVNTTIEVYCNATSLTDVDSLYLLQRCKNNI